MNNVAHYWMLRQVTELGARECEPVDPTYMVKFRTRIYYAISSTFHISDMKYVQ